jgi:hypothetical protein
MSPRLTYIANYNNVYKQCYIARYVRFEDLPVWQEAAQLYCSVLDLLEDSNDSFSFGFRSQLDRASLSVSNKDRLGARRSGTN